MANNVQFQDTDLATPPKTTTVETIDEGGGVSRQVVTLGSLGNAGAETQITTTVPISGTVILATASSLIVTQATAANLNATITGTIIATQATAANLNVTAALAANSTVIATQATATNLNVQAALAAGSTIIATQATAANLNVTAALAAGSNVIGHVITDSGSTTAVTGNVTVVQATAANLNMTAALAAGSTIIATQATAANLNVTAALAANSTVIATQATAANLNVTAAFAANSTVIATQATAANLNVTAATIGRDLLYDTGTNGFIISPLTLTAGTDLASLANGAAVTLSGGATGTFNQSNFGSAQYGYIYLQTVTTGFTPTAGGNVSGWWLFSPDGGTTFETTPATASTTVPALPRPPDWIIPLDAVALGATAVKVSLYAKLPEFTCKVLVQNNFGANFAAQNYTLKLVAPAKKN